MVMETSENTEEGLWWDERKADLVGDWVLNVNSKKKKNNGKMVYVNVGICYFTDPNFRRFRCSL